MVRSRRPPGKTWVLRLIPFCRRIIISAFARFARVGALAFHNRWELPEETCHATSVVP
jgi:hypothetical protein